MKARRYIGVASAAALALIGLQILQTHLLRDALARQNAMLADRLQATLVHVLNEAHKAKDDLAVYHMVSALAQSPGVVEVRIADPGREQISRSLRSHYDYPLRLGAVEWGRLVFSLSDHFNHALVRRQCIIGNATAGVAWSLLLFYLVRQEKKTHDLRMEITNLIGSIEAERRKCLATEGRERLSTRQAIASLHKAVEKLAEPVVILNAHQRISAVNPQALSRLGISDSKDIIGKSWNEVPVLESCGAALERSLESPGQIIDYKSAGSGLELRFITYEDGLSGTWISFG